MENLLGPVVFLVWLLLVGAAVAVAVAVFRDGGADTAGHASWGRLLERLRRRGRSEGN